MTNRQRVIAAVAIALALVAMGARFGGVEGQLTFVIAAVALIGLAWLLGEATEQAGGTVGPRASALLNASFGNLPEIVIVVLAINAGLNDIARASIIGSVTGNILLILGLALFLGGWRNGIQKFNARLAATNSSMLVLAVIGMGVPTLFQRVHPAAHDAELLSVWTAVVLVGIYFAYVYFSFATPGLRYIQAGHARPGAGGSRWCSVGGGGRHRRRREILVKSIEPVVHEWGLPRAFIGCAWCRSWATCRSTSPRCGSRYRNSVDFAMGISSARPSRSRCSPRRSRCRVDGVGHGLTLVFRPSSWRAGGGRGGRHPVSRGRDELARGPPADRDLPCGAFGVRLRAHLTDRACRWSRAAPGR